MTNRPHKVAVAAAIASIALAACGGGSKTPGVASLNGAGGPGATTTTLPHGTPTALLDSWASCMRNHGYPDMTDPYIDSNGTIHITMPQTGNGNTSGPVVFGGPNSTCSSYLRAASNALGGGQPGQKPSYAKLLKFSRCMRSHGIADFPDPKTGGGLQLHAGPGSDLDPNAAAFQNASKTCAKSAGVPQLGTGSPRGGIAVNGGGDAPKGGQAGQQGLNVQSGGQ